MYKRQAIANLESSAAEIDLKTAENNIKTAEIELVQIDKSISQLEYESKLTTAELEKNKSAYNDYNAEIDRLQNELSEAVKLTEEANNEKVISEQSQKELELSSRTLEESFQNIQNLFNEAKISLERLTGEKRNSVNLITRNTEVIDQLKSSIKRKENDIANSKNELELLDGAIADMEVDLDDLKRSRDNLKQNENRIEQNYSAKRVESLEIEKKLKQIRAERDSVSELMHAADIKIHENSLKLKNIFENIFEKYAVQIEPVQPEENYDIKTVKAEIRQIEEQLRNLGPVNLLAYEEFVEEKSRFDDFTQQKNDLIDAEKDLIKTIEEINETAQRLFFETFEAIRTNFNRIFQSLFRPGDESDLKLEEGVDPLEAKIEIIAKPRGKRPTSIELLSGGEKTLTAIALLFAIYLVKPSPFCILDEIDAPLDDANIDRFTNIIREFSLNTQFIVVTHNKRTMEAADVLYGVTMQEEGISKLVSVKFNEDYAIKN
ncbi:MAG: hypothetical protein IAE91_04180 [Ignavibacteriaceae bacterium]|nr:hypothetical protein [Ignavibacteriaceae bacterium]